MFFGSKSRESECRMSSSSYFFARSHYTECISRAARAAHGVCVFHYFYYNTRYVQLDE